jgi:hypothetical protein
MMPMKRWLLMEPLLAFFDKITAEQLRIFAAWVFVLTSLWWIAALFRIIAKEEPFNVLHLSFAAFWVSAFTLLVATDLEKKQ